MDTPLIFQRDSFSGVCSGGSQCCVSKDYYYQKGTIIENQEITPDSFPGDFTNKNAYFFKGCGNITISGCSFLNCSTRGKFGGGLLVNEDTDIKLHNSFFYNCYSAQNGGGAAISLSIVITEKNGSPIISCKQSHDIYIQYCCFSNCHATNSNGFGSAIMMSGNIVRLFYASTINCPGHNNPQFRGAQFDMDAVNLSSQFVNATGGNSMYCGAMEYRNASTGFFQFQTVTNMNCKYAISFTSVDIKGLRITTCNINNNKLNVVKTENEDANVPALVFVQKKNLILEKFFFYNNDFGTKGVYAEKENMDHITITLINCYSNNPDTKLINKNYVTTQNCHFTNTIIETTEFDLLKLKDCQGKKSAGPLIISSFFTPSDVFTPSSVFSGSNIFTFSNTFTGSEEFSYSQYFTQSNSFVESNSFSSSDEFTQSSSFTKTNTFSSTGNFTNSNTFSHSNSFTKSTQFTSSNTFTPTNKFSNSNKFTNSNKFLPSNKFTKSNVFTCTSTFSLSSEFTKSRPFINSNQFSPSNKFSSSVNFTATQLPAVIAPHNGSDNGDKAKKIGIIAGISTGGAVVLGGVIAGIVFAAKRTNLGIHDQVYIKVKKNEPKSTTVNPLAEMMEKDDPFADDFNIDDLE